MSGELLYKFKTGNCHDCNSEIIVSCVKYARRNIGGEYFEEVLEGRGSILKIHASKYILVCKACLKNNHSKLGANN